MGQNGSSDDRRIKQIRQIDLFTEPGSLRLHCPFCGTQVFDCSKTEPLQTCQHTKFAGTGNWDSLKHMADKDDLCFMSYESDCPEEEYIFLFNEPERPSCE